MKSVLYSMVLNAMPVFKSILGPKLITFKYSIQRCYFRVAPLHIHTYTCKELPTINHYTK